MVEEYFYGITLEGDGAVFRWDAEEMKAENADNGYPADASHKLLIRQILLGPKAAEDELNVVEIETISVKGKVKIPIAVLKVGETRQLSVDLEFPDSPVVFTLSSGKGPVHLLGQHLEQIPEEEMNMDLEEEDEDDEVSDDQDVPVEKDGVNPPKKIKLSQNNHKKPSKSEKGKKHE